MAIAYVDQRGQRYLDDIAVDLAGQTTIDHADGSYRLSPLRISTGELALTATGRILPTEAGLGLALEVASESGSLKDVFTLLPPTASANLRSLEPRG